MENERAIEIIKGELMHCQIHLEDKNKAPEYYQEMNELCEAYETAIKALESSSWIPVKTKDLTAEETEELIEKTEHMFSADEIEKWCYCCPLPEDDQDVLITAKSASGKIRYVTKVTFYIDDVYGCYFEGYEDRDDVLAWMPLPQPQPYTKEETK